MVHRSLIRAYNLGEGGLTQEESQRLPETADHISKTERTSMEAERASVDRFTAAYLATRIGEVFAGRISGVTRFGLFVSLNETGADGLVPIRSLPQDYYVHSEEEHALVGRRTGRIFRLCAPVWVRVVEADRLTGSSIFELEDADDGAEVPGFTPKKPHKAAPKFMTGPRDKKRKGGNSRNERSFGGRNDRPKKGKTKRR